uniref:Uncharacterized protein n=1 Tax=Rhizophora mucronata TaxID=61149 RepID=A0A2P2QNB3_RHIMU
MPFTKFLCSSRLVLLVDILKCTFFHFPFFFFQYVCSCIFVG